MKVKPGSNSASQTLTATSSKEERVLVQETLRISANIASASPPVAEGNELRSYERSMGLLNDQFVDSSLRLICFEEIDGQRWKYMAESKGSKQFKKGSIRAVSLQSPKAPVEVILSSSTSN